MSHPLASRVSGSSVLGFLAFFWRLPLADSRLQLYLCLGERCSRTCSIARIPHAANQACWWAWSKDVQLLAKAMSNRLAATSRELQTRLSRSPTISALDWSISNLFV